MNKYLGLEMRENLKTENDSAKKVMSDKQNSDSASQMSSRSHEIASLQNSIGNRAVLGLYQTELLNPKLPGKHEIIKYEQKARQAADKISKGSLPLTSFGQTQDQALTNAGHQDIQTGLNKSSSKAKLHTDQNAAQMNNQLNSRAFTYGKDVYFSQGAYSPETITGKRLLTHELTHVQQQENKQPFIQKEGLDAGVPAGVPTPEPIEGTETRDAADVPQNTMPSGDSQGGSRFQIPWESTGRYSAQFRQLEIELGSRMRARAVTMWAINYFQASRTTEDIATALTRKVDDALFTVNRWFSIFNPLIFFDLTSRFDLFREPIDDFANMYLERSRTPWLITYRIPRPLAVAVEAVEQVRGKCEEHAFLAIYLLTIAHMIQEMPYGRLTGDIYYTGAGTPEHARVVLVKGTEFKEAVRACIAATGRIDGQWLATHTNLWGSSAYIVDGWSGETIQLASQSISFDYHYTQSFRRDPQGNSPSRFDDSIEESPQGGLTSEWDATIYMMAVRVANDYGLTECQPANPAQQTSSMQNEPEAQSIDTSVDTRDAIDFPDL